MRIFVDELPKRCLECGFCCKDDLGYWCQGREDVEAVFIADEMCIKERLRSCPLLSLADHTKQVRKEVFASLKEKYKQKMQNALDDFDEELGHINCDEVLEELLEEIGFNEVLELYQSQKKWYS